MKVFKAEIIESVYFNGRECLRIKNDKEGKDFLLPKSQILFSVEIGKKYDFSIEFNSRVQKEFFSIMHPKYLADTETIFEIEGTSNDDINTYYILKSEFRIPIKVKKLPHQSENKSTVKCRINRYKMGKPILTNIDFQNENFQLGQRYEFEIVNFSKFIDKKGNEVESLEVTSSHLSCDITVRAYDWHKKHIWNFKSIECEVIGFDKNSNPKLKVLDKRHPYYLIGSNYKFIIKEVVRRVNQATGQPYFILIISDEYGFLFEVSALPNQERRVEIGAEIECKVKGVDTKVRLSQVNAEDPYFYKFDEIVLNPSFKKNYFLNLFKDNQVRDENIEQFKSQYNASQGFWVFSYCNYILPNEFNSLIFKKDYARANEVNELLILFETWILNNGILRAINGDEERKSTKRRINRVLSNCYSKRKVLAFLINSQVDEFFNSQIGDVDYQDLFYFFLFSDINILDGHKIVPILEMKSYTENEKNLFEKIGDVIEVKKQVYLNKMNDNYFVMLSKSELTKEHIENLKLWTYCQFILYSKSNIQEKKILALAKLIRYSLLPGQETPIKVKLLSNAYNILVENKNKLSPQFDENYNIIIKDLEDNPNINSSNASKWEEIEKAEQENRFLTLKVVEPYFKGFKVEYKGILGFLPYQNISCISLRQYKQKKIFWEISANVILSGKVFGLFTVKQLNQDHHNFLSRNLNIDNLPEIGSIINGRVKNIVDFGIFISSEFGDGLLHLNNLDDEFEDKRESLNNFIEGEEIVVVLINITHNKKLEFGFKQLIGTAYEGYYYKKLFGSIDDAFELDNVDIDSVRKKIEVEKGNIIEQFAALTQNLEEKIKYIKLSKYFFSNTNNAKSYLHNIYIEYFQRIKDLDIVIRNYSFDSYNHFRQKIKEIKLQPRTLEEFPESENLIVFIKILALFNNTDTESNATLFELVQKFSNNDEKRLLSVLSKTTFANNLMMSEVMGENMDERIIFSLKNLKVIRNYIENGVFSLAESKEDKLARELEEKRIYWKGKINQDEGEKLEFKSTLITPVPDDQKKKILESLNDKLSIVDEKAKIGILKKIDEIKGDNAQKRIIHSAFKTISAFANTNGGILLLGVSDDKSIYGLEKDYDSFDKLSEKNRDGFGKFLDSKLKSYFGNGFSSQFLEKEFLNFPEGDILIIQVKKSEDEIFLLRDEDGKLCPGDLYVRNLSSSDKLEGVELSKFIKSRTSMRIYSL